MKKKIIIPVAGAVILIIGFIYFGWYPVVLVGSSFISESSWKHAQRAAERFALVQAQMQAGKPLEISETQKNEMLAEIKKGTLTFLIEDKIIQKRGHEIVPGLDKKSKERISSALARNPQFEEEARNLYGLNQKELMAFVLMPQARQDILRDELSMQNKKLEDWLPEQKKKAKVRIFFIPYRWNGEEVR